MSRLVFPRPSTQVSPIRFSAEAERKDVAGDRSGPAMVLMKSSGSWKVCSRTFCRARSVCRRADRGAVGSAIHHAHVLVPFTAGRAFRCRLVDPFQVLARQGDSE